MLYFGSYIVFLMFFKSSDMLFFGYTAVFLMFLWSSGVPYGLMSLLGPTVFSKYHHVALVLWGLPV